TPLRSAWTARVPILGQTWRDNVFVERRWRSVKYEEVVCCGNLLRGGEGQLYQRWRKVLRRRSEGAVFKPPQAARVKSSRGERCWKRRGSPRQVCLMKTNVSEPLMTCRNVNSDVETTLAVHADRNGVLHRHGGEIGACERAALIGVENLRLAVFRQGLLQLHRATLGGAPGQLRPVDDRREIDETARRSLEKLAFPLSHLVWGTSNRRASSASVFSPLKAAKATFASKAGACFPRVRFVITSPDSRRSCSPRIRQKIHLSACADL